MKKCKLDDCDNPLAKGGYCNRHYIRNLRHGNPHYMKRPAPGSPKNCGAVGQCPANKRLLSFLDYTRNKDKYLERARKQHADGYYAIQKERYFSREDIKERSRARTRQWVIDNPDRKKSGDKKWAIDNPDKVRAINAKRRASVRDACRPWLTNAHRKEMESVYSLSIEAERNTGIRHDVDHIFPLQAKYACGLHIPSNLRVMTRSANLKRPRVWTSEMLTDLAYEVGVAGLSLSSGSHP